MQTSREYYGMLHGLDEPEQCQIDHGIELRPAPIPQPWSSIPGSSATTRGTWHYDRTDPASARGCDQDLAHSLASLILPDLLELLDRTALRAELRRIPTTLTARPVTGQGPPAPTRDSRLDQPGKVYQYLLWASIDDVTPQEIEDLLVRYEQDARVLTGTARHSNHIMRRWARAHTGCQLPSP